MRSIIIDAHGQKWITLPETWDNDYFEVLSVPGEGKFMKLRTFVEEILELPKGWILDVIPKENNELDIIFDNKALDKYALTYTIIMCNNNYGPCLMGLYQMPSNDCVYGETYLKITIYFH